MNGGGRHINWTPIWLALLLALLGFWLNRVGGRVETVDNAGFTHDPDYIVEEFNALAFDLNGNPQRRLVATRMTHFMDDDTTVLDNPSLRTLDPGLPLLVSAKRALLSTDGQQVYFLNKVHVERTYPDGGLPITLDTEYLHISADARTMRTHKPVSLKQGLSITTANSLLADDYARTLTLTGNVRGVYEHAR